MFFKIIRKKAKDALVDQINKNSNLSKPITAENLSDVVTANVLDAWIAAYEVAFLMDMFKATKNETESKILRFEIYKNLSNIFNENNMLNSYNSKEGLYLYNQIDDDTAHEGVLKIKEFEKLLFATLFIENEAFNETLKLSDENSPFNYNSESGFLIDKNNLKLSLFEKFSFAASLLNVIPPYTIIKDYVESDFNISKVTNPTPVDPILIDLDGDGIETTTVANGIFFDHDNDGFSESSAWVGSDDGILAYDKNNNGIIDNGNEIFGDNYIKSDGTKASSGFDALSDLDRDLKEKLVA